MPRPSDTAEQPRPWLLWFTLYACAVTSLSAALVLHRYYTFDGAHVSYGRALAWQSAVFFSWGALVPAVAWAGRRLRVRRGPLAGPWLAPLPAYAAGLAAVPAAHALFASVVSWLARPVPDGVRPPLGRALPALLVDRLPVDLLVYSGVVGALYAVSHAAEVRRRERDAAALEAELARAQLHALRARLQPHFLFNALQGIAALVPRDPDAAVRMTAALGDLLRATLQRPGDQEVPLRDELRLLGSYLEVETARFRDRLRVTYDVAPDALGCRVPDLVLQPLAENAVKHGLSPKRGAGRLTIGARRAGGRLTLWVADDGVGLAGYAGDGLGLAITRERLAHLYGDDHALALAPADGAGTRVTIDIPAREAGV